MFCLKNVKMERRLISRPNATGGITTNTTNSVTTTSYILIDTTFFVMAISSKKCKGF